MVDTNKPSRWAVEQFGDAAMDIAKHVIKGLMRGQRTARIVQAAARAEGATDNHAFGSMWNTRYQVIVEQFELADLPGYDVIKPKGASYWLAVVNGRVLIPFRHASSMNKPIGKAKLGSLIPRRIARDNGVLPEPTLFDEPEGIAPGTETAPDSPTVGEVAADARALNLTVVYVGYVANADSDEIQAVWWGTPVSLEDNGTMVWFPEQLDPSIANEHTSGVDTGLRAVGTAADTPGFAQGDAPELDVIPRPHHVESPASEAEPDTSDVVADDE